MCWPRICSWSRFPGFVLVAAALAGGHLAPAGTLDRPEDHVAIQRLTSLTPNATQGTGGSKVAVDDSGTIHVAYQIFENSQFPELGEIGYFFSTDGGEMWEGVNCYTRYDPAIAVTSDGAVFIASVRCGEVGHWLLGEAVVYDRLVAGPPHWEFESWLIDTQEGIGAQYSGFFGPPSLALEPVMLGPPAAVFVYEFSRPEEVIPTPHPEEGNLRLWKSCWEPFPAEPVDLLSSGTEHTFQAPAAAHYVNSLFESRASCIVHVHRGSVDSIIHLYERPYGGEWATGTINLGTTDTMNVRDLVHGVASRAPDFPDPPQRLHAAWVEESEGGGSHIFHRVAGYEFVPGQYIWSPSAQVSYSQERASHPVIAHKRSVPMVIWEGANDSGFYEIWWSYWNGSGWEEPLNVSETPDADSRYPHICYVPNADPATGYLHIIWTEPWQGIWEVRYERMLIGELPGEELE
ncbi:hypothetical protein AMJ39_09720 [candidate division TA06 bacterium DG_24]|uniref:Exo-alpha-sialidase n=1 Tax=candidate division TA06 bacterium DG_24 TaxID=1703770 RepID=A0A0S7WPJ4_UNCT6|nr:MAG: hypothetical protein AMJ39_09720 [candidate division TA06 bacterium DG_24]